MDNETDVILETPNEETEVETVETPETPTETKEETLETPEVDVEQLQATNKKLFERAKKAEAEAKALKAKATPVESSKASPSNVEETVLLAQGVPEELIEELKLRAPKHGGSLIKAQKDPKYVAIKDSFEKEQKQKNSSLPASRGSGSVKPKKDLTTPGLTREEHKRMVMESE